MSSVDGHRLLISFDSMSAVDGHRLLISFDSMGSVDGHRLLISFLHCKVAVKAKGKVEFDQRPATSSRKAEQVGQNRKQIGHIDRKFVSDIHCSTKEIEG